jgi:hypothetical protein
MLQTPWHLRTPTHQQRRRYHQLVELHQLTTAWIQELQEKSERPSHFLDRGLNPSLTRDLWMLEALDEKAFDQLLDDTQPEDVLNRLEQMIWQVQTYTYRKFSDQTQSDGKSILASVLEQISWKRGRENAARKWAGLSNEARADLRELVPTLMDQPFGRFLVIRNTRSEAWIELLDCAHKKLTAEAGTSANELCHLHQQWIRGYMYELNPRLHIDTHLKTCQLRWSLE